MISATSTQPQPTTFLQLDTQASHYKWLVTSIVLVAGATQSSASTNVNLVIPRLMTAFGTDLTTPQWLATGFLLTPRLDYALAMVHQLTRLKLWGLRRSNCIRTSAGVY
jgi:hypothetical protein